ncbi:carbohydrate porin [Ancylobacter sp. MQZ15Z-1]|uniref:Carbohydrate porin n=1 Tax=Ancylobacter mangrovi TaxID=2972472 RepID=A0A9X2PBI8_9HYPH|nr:carbohydrate porin [Ancylobacter mangrovi]MCS0493861.1 carbohydrate porin [Ancylobacter mangrovi]
MRSTAFRHPSRPPGAARLRALACAAASFIALPALADPAGAPASDWLTRDTLTGDWGGTRTALADKGITVTSNWIVDALGNASGGIRQGAAMDGQHELEVALDLDKLAGWKGASVVASLYWLQGSNLSDDVGNLLTLTNIAGDAGARLGELYLENHFADDRLTTRIGQIAIDEEFAVSDTAGLFVNSAFGWPGIYGVDLPGGGPADPLPTPGAWVRWAPDDAFSVQAAAFNGNPLGGAGGNADGLDFPLDDGVLAIVEASYVHKGANGLIGTFRLGAWYNSETFDDLSVAANGLSLADPAADGPLAHQGDYSLYAIADQQLWASSTARLSGFVRVAWAPEDRNEVSFYVDTGLALTGPLPGRPNDVAGIGLAYAKISPALARLDRTSNALSGTDGPVQDYEAVLEIDYQAAVTPWLSVQPFFQYVFHPGGNVPDPNGSNPTQALRDAAVFGVRSTVTF